MSAVIGRLLLLGLALVSIVVGIVALRDQHACSSALSDAVTVGRGDATGAARLEDRLAQRCSDPAQQTRGVFALGSRGHSDQAVALARHMTRSAPDGYEGWAVLAQTLAGRDAAGARAAFARAHALNPRASPAPPRAPAQ